MNVAIVSANLGSYDPPNEWPALEKPAGINLVIRRLTDADVTPRPLAMTSRLMCGIPKWFGVDFTSPMMDAIIWIDASCAPTAGFVPWFLQKLSNTSTDVAAFLHPERRTVQEEYEFIKARMARPGETYLNSRYRGEWLDDQMAHVRREGFEKLPLFATTAFIYRPRPHVLSAFRDVFLWKARYHLHDQLAFSCALQRHGCMVRLIEDNYLKCDALTFTRNRK